MSLTETCFYSRLYGIWSPACEHPRYNLNVSVTGPTCSLILAILYFLNAHLCPKNLIRPKMFQSWLNIWLNISWYWLIIEFESHFWPMAIALRPKYGVLVSKNILSLDHLDIFDHFGHLSVWVRKKQGLPIFFCLQRTANSNIFISNIQHIRQIE